MDRESWQVYRTYADEAISGASLVRPGIQALLDDLRRGRFSVILTESVDRLSRDREDIAHIYKAARFVECRTVTLSEGAVNELHIGLNGTMGALYLKDLADKTRGGLSCEGTFDHHWSDLAALPKSCAPSSRDLRIGRKRSSMSRKRSKFDAD